ncbi:branched-chain amino acid ABC transporter permease [Derxia gummosa]|uniref:Branched-chain amino acid ABC transporter permease n=1 Tax=Derxia gummosa DSM 723 TaxID=1121388 RepID=A0A8B6XBC9_9BURK|nr:branched-chain amino acid ABC transporter permease [Derxia gummosa]
MNAVPASLPPSGLPWFRLSRGAFDAGLLLALVALPLLAPGWQVDLVLKVLVLALFAVSLELLVGHTGLVSLGHAAFFGIGAYVPALLASDSEPGSLLLLGGAAMLAAAGYALAVGLLTLRSQGIYFIMVTLAFGQMAYHVAHDTKLAGGTDGIYLYLRPLLAVGSATLVDTEDRVQLYWLVLGTLVAAIGCLNLVLHSRFGRALAGVRVNETRMRATGYATYPYKVAIFVLAAVLAALAGFFQTVKDGFVSPESLSWHQSGAVLVMCILGGLGSLRGAVLGAVAFVGLQELFQSEALFGDFARHWQLGFGLAIIVCVALMPRGLVHLVGDAVKRLGRASDGGQP